MGHNHKIFKESFLHLTYRLTQFRNFVIFLKSDDIFKISATPRTNVWQVSLTLTWYQKSKISLNLSNENLIRRDGDGENYL
jgi:hypothetical protein